MRRISLGRPDHRLNGKFQFVVGWTGGGAEECKHLTKEQIETFATGAHGPGKLIDDGELWWEIPDSFKLLTWRDAIKKEIKNTIEIGEIKWSITLRNSGVAQSYTLRLVYSFDYNRKGGECGEFGIQNKFDTHAGEYVCDGTGEKISEVLCDALWADFPTATPAQLNDMVSEVIENIQSLAKRHNWMFFNTDYDRHEYHNG